MGFPFTSKADLIDIGANPACLKSKLTCVGARDILRWHKTSGTAAKGVSVADTAADWDGYAEVAAEALHAMGVRQDDVVVVAFGYGPFIAFWGYIAALEKIGATFLPSGGMDAMARINLIREFDATVFMSTPSYSIHVGETARAEGLNLGADTNVRIVVQTGEPSTRLTKQKVSELWGARPADKFGTTETGGIAFECPTSPRTYHIQEGYVVPEFINPSDGKAAQPGEEAELIVTPLCRRGMPVFRFRTGNLVKLSKATECSCGRTYRSLEETENGVVLRRLDRLLKIRGVLVDPIAIENVVRSFDAAGEEYRILFEKKDAFDEIRVQVELKDKGPGAATVDELRRGLAEEIRRKVMLKVGVELVPFGSLERFQEKGKRIIDLR